VRGQAQEVKGVVGAVGEVAEGVDEGTVEVEDYGLYVGHGGIVAETGKGSKRVID